MLSEAAMTAPKTGEKKSLYEKKRHPFDLCMKTLIYLSAAITVTLLVGILLYILINGIGHISWEFISTEYSQRASSPEKGILPMIINTVYVVVLTLLISVPIGVCAAVTYLFGGGPEQIGDAIRNEAYVKECNTETGAWDFVAVQGIE